MTDNLSNTGHVFRYAEDGEGNYGFLGADDSLIPFHNVNAEKIKIWHYNISNPASVYTSPTYTATEDCFLIGLFQDPASCYMYINGELQAFDSANKYGSNTYDIMRDLKKGDTFYGVTYNLNNGDYWGKVQQITFITVSR